MPTLNCWSANPEEAPLLRQYTEGLLLNREAISLGVRWRRLRRNLRASLYARLPRLFHLQGVAYTIALECRSSLLRIGSLCRPVGVYPNPSVKFGQVAGRSPVGRLILCSRTQACTEDMQKLASLYPWATFQEIQVFVEAWRAGVEWGRRDGHTCSACSELTTEH